MLHARACACCTSSTSTRTANIYLCNVFRSGALCVRCACAVRALCVRCACGVRPVCVRCLACAMLALRVPPPACGARAQAAHRARLVRHNVLSVLRRRRAVLRARTATHCLRARTATRRYLDKGTWLECSVARWRSDKGGAVARGAVPACTMYDPLFLTRCRSGSVVPPWRRDAVAPWRGGAPAGGGTAAPSPPALPASCPVSRARRASSARAPVGMHGAAQRGAARRGVAKRGCL